MGKPRNPHARALAERLFRQRRVTAKKGKGSYRRRPKHTARGGDALLGGVGFWGFGLGGGVGVRAAEIPSLAWL